jgi:hypothetical protein
MNIGKLVRENIIEIIVLSSIIIGTTSSVLISLYQIRISNLIEKYEVKLAIEKKENLEKIKLQKTSCDDQVIVDPITGLMWQKHDDSEKRSFYEALAYAKNSELAGYADWRLPTFKEVQVLFEGRAREEQIIEANRSAYWYIDSKTGDEGKYINFSNSEVLGIGKGINMAGNEDNKYYTRLVLGKSREIHLRYIDNEEKKILYNIRDDHEINKIVFTKEEKKIIESLEAVYEIISNEIWGDEKGTLIQESEFINGRKKHLPNISYEQFINYRMIFEANMPNGRFIGLNKDFSAKKLFIHKKGITIFSPKEDKKNNYPIIKLRPGDV